MQQATARIPIQINHGVVVALLQTDLTEAVLQQFQDELQPRVHGIGAHGVVVDVSGLAVLDDYEFAGLRRVLAMVELLGAQSIISGLSPGMVSAQTLREAARFHPHIHALCSMDEWNASGRWCLIP